MSISNSDNPEIVDAVAWWCNLTKDDKLALCKKYSKSTVYEFDDICSIYLNEHNK